MTDISEDAPLTLEQRFELLKERVNAHERIFQAIVPLLPKETLEQIRVRILEVESGLDEGSYEWEIVHGFRNLCIDDLPQKNPPH